MYNVLNITKYAILGILLIAIINSPFILLGTYLNSKYYYIYMKYDLLHKTIFVLIMCFLAPILEELYFRYYAYNIIKDKYGVPTSIITSSLMYMVFYGMSVKLHLFLSGVVYTMLYEKTKTIWTSIIAHIASMMIWFLLTYYG